MVLGVVRRLDVSRDGAIARHHGWAATDLNVLSTVFLRMIKSLIVPLLFATLVVGIAGHGDDMKRVGRLAFRSIIYFEVVTTLALAVGSCSPSTSSSRAAASIVVSGIGGAGERQLAATQRTFSGVLEHTRAAELLRGGGQE